MKGLIIQFGALEMLQKMQDNLVETPYDVFLSLPEKALRDGARHKVRLAIERLKNYRKFTGERIITLRDGREYRFISA